MSILAVLFLSPSFSIAQDDHLVLSQVQVSGDGGASDEFIEIFNPTDNPVSINGWSVQYKSSSASFPLTSGKKNLPDAMIQPNSYYLITHSSYNGQVVADHTHSAFSMSGAQAGATIFLVSSTSFVSSGSDQFIVDKLGYGTGTTNSPEGSNAPLPESEKTLVRQGDDTDDNATDFVVANAQPRNSGNLFSPAPAPTPTPTPTVVSTPSPTPTPTPTHTPTPTSLPTPTPTPKPVEYPKGIIISEFLPNPDGKDSGAEWIELYSRAGVNIDLSGWKLSDQKTFYTLGSYMIEPGSYIVVSLPSSAFDLNNTGGDTVKFFWPNDQVVDEISYTEDADEGTSYALDNNGKFKWTSLVTKGANNKFTPVERISSDNGKVAGQTTVLNVSEEVEEEVMEDEMIINEDIDPDVLVSADEENLELERDTKTKDKESRAIWPYLLTLAFVIIIIFWYISRRRRKV